MNVARVVVVSAADVVAWLTLFTIFWMISLVVRRPRDVRLRSITAVVTCSAVGIYLADFAVAGRGVLGFDPMSTLTMSHLLAVTGAYCILCFFLFAAYAADQARVRARRHALVLLLVIAVLLVIGNVIPAPLRTAAAMITSSSHDKVDVLGEPSIALFYLTANSFLLYANGSAALSARRAARYAKGSVRLGLHTATTGLTLVAVSYVVIVYLNIVRWTGNSAPYVVRLIVGGLSLPGTALFLLGIVIPAAATRPALVRIWWRHLRTYHALAPLWSVLHKQFPEDALIRSSPGIGRDRLPLIDVHRRFYRRVIECRDGLVRISPYVVRIQETTGHAATTPQELADQLRQALRAHAAGVDVADRAMPIAVPATSALDDDVTELLILASALRANGATASDNPKGAA